MPVAVDDGDPPLPKVPNEHRYIAGSKINVPYDRALPPCVRRIESSRVREAPKAIAKRENSEPHRNQTPLQRRAFPKLCADDRTWGTRRSPELRIAHAFAAEERT